MDFPDFVWAAADIVSSSTDYSEKISKYLKLISDECNAENRIVWIPDEEKGLMATNFDIEDPGPFFNIAASAYSANSASVSRANGLYVMTLPVTESNSDYRACVQIIRSSAFSREDLNFFIGTGDLLSKIFTEFRPRTPVVKKTGTPIISAKDLRKSYTSGDMTHEVLHGLNFDVYENELVVILGASGTGKTTLLNILGGLDRADRGSLCVGKTDLCKISNESMRKYRRNEVGFVFQFYNLLPNLTAFENIKYVSELSIKKASPMKALESVGLADCADKYPSQMSSGQQQRVSIARALVKKPRFILADEPTGALDLDSSKEVLGVFENIVNNENGTVVLVTHNNEVAKIADKVIKIDQGRIASIINNTYKMKAADLVW